VVGVVDCGLGNSSSVVGALTRIGAEVCLLRKPEGSTHLTHIVLPGVGHFSTYINALRESGLDQVIQRHAVEQQKPLLGICVGAQVLGIASEESRQSGLGLVPMKTRRLATRTLRVPNIGWHITKWRSSVQLHLEEQSRLYFSHSFVLEPDDADDELATICYGVTEVVAVRHKNIVCVQFHPEKSHQGGLRFLKWFVNQPVS
jgi:imidazole glycerol phosphate synthase glutamine amidotransferase subunit